MYGSDVYEDLPRMGGLEYLGISLVTVVGFIGLVALWLIA